VRRWALCFLLSFFLVVTILFASERIHGIEFLFLPGILVSLRISHRSDTSDFSFIAGMILNAVCFTFLINVVSNRVKQRTKLQ
jgi:hypothetical protein